MSSGGPAATISPPPSPPSGPRSMIESVVLMTSRLCSTRTSAARYVLARLLPGGYRMANKLIRPHRSPVLKRRAVALGAVAIGALAIGAVAIGRLAIGGLVIKRARISQLEVDELTVRRLRV